MHIRQATATESDCIGKILAVAYEPVMRRMTNAEAAAFAGSLPGAVARYGNSGTWLLAERQDKPVGAVAFFAPGSTTHPLFQGNVAHVQLLGVVPGQTHSGIAQSLMAECFSMGANSGASELLLQTSELMPEARRLYERLGFKLRKQLPPVWGAPTYLYAKSEA